MPPKAAKKVYTTVRTLGNMKCRKKKETDRDNSGPNVPWSVSTDAIAGSECSSGHD
jgi:hypothetical protein